MRIALTGGIGSGKSYVCSLLKKRGLEVYDCDNAAKKIMRSSINVRQKLISVIGQDTYDGDVPNKRCIASFILASKSNAEKINSIVHPAVAADYLRSGINFMECAILFSSGFDKLVDKIVCISAPLDVRLERVMKRDKISRDKALEWISCQMPQDEVERRSDFIIENDGNTSLEKQIDMMLSILSTNINP